MTKVVEMMRVDFVMLDAAQLARLLEIVTQEHRQLRDGVADMDEFSRAFWVAGTFYRRQQPDSSRYYSYWLEAAARRLEDAGSRPVSGPAFLAAVLAWIDIPWQKPDPGVGDLLELGISEHTGRRANDTWKDLLAGERGMLKPVLRDRGIKRQDGVFVVRSASAD